MLANNSRMFSRAVRHSCATRPAGCVGIRPCTVPTACNRKSWRTSCSTQARRRTSWTTSSVAPCCTSATKLSSSRARSCGCSLARTSSRPSTHWSAGVPPRRANSSGPASRWMMRIRPPWRRRRSMASRWCTGPRSSSVGRGEQVRQVQYETFLEHFGNMSKTPELWQHHIESQAFTPDFSLAAIDEVGEVVGYVLGSTYITGVGSSEERSAHTDYIGVRRDQRRRGIAEFLLKKIWLAALRRGLAVASLGTDINNRSNAHLLYRRLGYVAVENQFAYRIDNVAEAK